MNDIQRRDRKLFLQALIEPGPVIVLAIVCLFIYGISHITSRFPWYTISAGYLTAFGIHTWSAWQRSIKRRFRDRKFASLWESCTERLHRFDEALNQMRKRQIASFEDMPRNVHALALSLYQALRRADTVYAEIRKSEGWMMGHPPPLVPPASDPQAQELYRMADRNIAEYRQNYSSVISGVQRTEAQAAVFTTTLDSMRMKMLGYRLVGNSPEVASRDFMESMAEAKIQLMAIDKALEELELVPFPRTITLESGTTLGGSAVISNPQESQTLHQGEKE